MRTFSESTWQLNGWTVCVLLPITNKLCVSDQIDQRQKDGKNDWYVLFFQLQKKSQNAPPCFFSFISHMDAFLSTSVGVCTYMHCIYPLSTLHKWNGLHKTEYIFKLEPDAFSKPCLLRLKTHQTPANSLFSNDFVKKDIEIRWCKHLGNSPTET